MIFGFVLCLDSFLYTFTILPIRFVLAFGKLVLNTLMNSSPPLPPSQKADILRALLLVISIVFLSPLTDASKIYHFIRGQDTIKLYVIFNALEVCNTISMPLCHRGLFSPLLPIDCRPLVRGHRPRCHRLLVLKIDSRGHIAPQTSDTSYLPASGLLHSCARIRGYVRLEQKCCLVVIASVTSVPYSGHGVPNDIPQRGHQLLRPCSSDPVGI